jgi:predicted transcriptional regulator
MSQKARVSRSFFEGNKTVYFLRILGESVIMGSITK